jgi:hypothetical protein
MLTNYLRSGVASNTYLPLTGGTLTGALNGTTGTFKALTINNNVSSGQGVLSILSNTFADANKIQFGDISGIRREILLPTGVSNLQFRTYALGGTEGGYSFYTRRNPNAEQLAFNIDFDGNSNFYGTLGVTGATTLTNLAGSGTRMVTASSTGLLSTQTIPTGTVTSVTGSSPISSSGGTTPNISMTAAGVNVSGYVTHDGTQIFTGNKSFLGQTTMTGIAFFKDYTYQATRLAGLSSTDRFATVTLGTGLTLSSGVLSAISGVTSVTASTPLSSSGGTIPNITITDAGTGASGVVTTGTQSFAGNKTFTGNVIISGASTLTVGSTGTFGGRINTPWLERTYTNTTSSSFTVSINTTWLDINTSVLTTLTLPNAATYPGKELHIRQTGGGSLQSASSNIIPFTVPPTGSTSTGILQPSTNRSVTLVSDGVNWIIMQRSGI